MPGPSPDVAPRRLPVAALLIVSFMGAVVGLVAQRPDPPMTMGRLALMAGSADAALLAALRGALTDTDPGLRFVAARITRTLKIPAVEPDLQAALTRESNVWVAAEMTRAMLMLDTPSSRRAAEAGIETAPARAGAYAAWLARTSPDRLIAQLPALAAALGDPSLLAAPLRLAAVQHTDLRDAVVHAATKLAGGAPWIDAVGTLAITDSTQPTMRSVESPWPGFLASVMEITGCRVTGDRQFGGLWVVYRRDGRIASAQTDVGSLPAACTATLAALARVSLADDHVAVDPDSRQWLLFSTHRDIVACADLAPANPGARPIEPSSRPADMVMPTLVRNVEPSYTRGEMQAKRQGSVEVRAVVGTTGCVRRAWIVRTLSQGLDSQAILAAARWQFKPMTVKGSPVDSVVSIILEFRLK